MKKIFYLLILLCFTVATASCKKQNEFTWLGDWNNPNDPNYKSEGYNPLAGVWKDENSDSGFCFTEDGKIQMIYFLENKADDYVIYSESDYQINKTGFWPEEDWNVKIAASNLPIEYILSGDKLELHYSEKIDVVAEMNEEEEEEEVNEEDWVQLSMTLRKKPSSKEYTWQGDWNDPKDPNYKPDGYNPIEGMWTKKNEDNEDKGFYFTKDRKIQLVFNIENQLNEYIIENEAPYTINETDILIEEDNNIIQYKILGDSIKISGWERNKSVRTDKNEKEDRNIGYTPAGSLVFYKVQGEHQVYAWGGDWNDPKDSNYKPEGYNPIEGIWRGENSPLGYIFTEDRKMVFIRFITNKYDEYIKAAGADKYIINSTGFSPNYIFDPITGDCYEYILEGDKLKLNRLKIFSWKNFDKSASSTEYAWRGDWNDPTHWMHKHNPEGYNPLVGVWEVVDPNEMHARSTPDKTDGLLITEARAVNPISIHKHRKNEPLRYYDINGEHSTLKINDNGLIYEGGSLSKKKENEFLYVLENDTLQLISINYWNNDIVKYVKVDSEVTPSGIHTEKHYDQVLGKWTQDVEDEEDVEKDIDEEEEILFDFQNIDSLEPWLEMHVQGFITLGSFSMDTDSIYYSTLETNEKICNYKYQRRANILTLKSKNKTYTLTYKTEEK